MDSLRIDIKSKFAQRLYVTRKERRMTADELGEAIGLNRATIYLYESGEIKSIKRSVLCKLAKYLNVTTDYLMGNTDDKNGSIDLDSSIRNTAEDTPCQKGIYNMNIFAKRLKEARIERNVSVAELSENIGLNKATLHRYENGEFKGIKAPVLHAIANYLDVDPAFLMGASDSMQADQEAKEEKDDISDEEKMLLQLFRQVPAENRQAVLEQLAVDVVRFSLKQSQ